MGEGEGVGVRHQHIESSSRKNKMFILVVSSSGVHMESICMFANMLLHFAFSTLVCSST